MVLNRSGQSIAHQRFSDLPSFLRDGDALVLNESRVIPARLRARKHPGGGKAEILLLARRGRATWLALVGGSGLKPGRRISIEGGPEAQVLEDLGGGSRLIQFSQPITDRLERIGAPPLPPYIHKPLRDPDEYQTVYARRPGSAAAPTAGLHFTQSLLRQLQESGVQILKISLHIGLDTFAPVTEENAETHAIHTEWCQIDSGTVAALAAVRAGGGRVIAVGTTSVRTLETAARAAPNGEWLIPHQGPTDLFILPGHQFRAVDAMVTNFHLPRSTLLMLVSAFAGREQILRAYAEAIAEGYRFYSFGDAMLIL